MKVLSLVIMLCIMQIPLFLCAQASLVSYSVLSADEYAELERMLAEAELLPEHTKFYRDWDPYTRLKSDWHMQVLQGGLDALPLFGDLREVMSVDYHGDILEELCKITFGVRGIASTQSRHEEIRKFADGIKKPADIFRYLERAFSELEPLMDAAFDDLSPAELDTLQAFCLQLMLEEEHTEDYRAYFEKHQLPWLNDMDLGRMADLLEKVDGLALGKAAYEYRIWAEMLETAVYYLELTNTKPIFHKSPWGLMVIGSIMDDTYNASTHPILGKERLCAIIDPAGNDVYEVPFVTSAKYPFYFLSDFFGADVYRGSEPFFLTLAGLGYSNDGHGDDVYQLGDFSFAAALGMGVHIDFSGDDYYQGGLFSQAAAIGGVYLLSDTLGNDVYRAHTMSQAFGSTLGAGVLRDGDGSDLYYLGGKYIHAPLMPNDFRTMGQGMGFGLRPALAGGLGLLYDKAGNDRYMGGVYAQGVGYWYSTGVLIDEGGNDVYNAVYYPQGSGIHMASGFLYDHEGDDAYYSRNGPGQGAGHDWSFGMLVDAGGNDAYSIHGGNGLGLSNSLGIFVDKSGNDRYERKEAQNYAHGAFSRSTGSIGLFLDAGGNDIYPEGVMVNDSTWVKGNYGIGRDIELNVLAEDQQVSDVDELDPPAVDAPVTDIFAAAAEWEVGSAVNRVRKAREIMLARAEEMQPYILEHKLGSQSGLEYRAIDAFLRGSEGFQTKILDYVNSPDSLKAKNVISLLAGVKDQRLLSHLEDFLNEGRYLASCISALGNLESEAGLRLLSQHRNLENERLRFLVVRSIAAYESEDAKQALQGFAADESFLIQALLRNLPKDTP